MFLFGHIINSICLDWCSMEGKCMKVKFNYFLSVLFFFTMARAGNPIPELAKVQFEYWYEQLSDAILYNNLNEAKKLLQIKEFGQSPIWDFDDQKKCLYMAAFSNAPAIVDFLADFFKLKEKIIELDDLGLLLLKEALVVNSVKVVDYLIGIQTKELALKQREFLLLLVAQKGALNSLQYLIEQQKWNPTVVNKTNGFYLIHEASFSGHAHIVEYLIVDCGVDPNLRTATEDQKTALHAASNKGHINVIKTLLSRSADIMAKDANGLLPLHETTIKDSSFDALKFYLEERKLDPTVTTIKAKKSLLHLAAQGNCLRTIAYLLKNTPLNKDVTDENGATPFKEAVICSSKGAISLLRKN